MKKTKFLLFILLIQSICYSQSPPIEWQKTFGGSNDDRANNIIQTTDGGYIATGYTESSDGDITNNQGLHDIWVVKLNSTGDIQWQKTFGGSGYEQGNEILQTIEGGYILTGWTASNNGNISTNYGGTDFWVIKLDPNGSLEWEKNFGGTGADFGVSIKQTSEGGFIIGGGTQSNDIDLSGDPRFYADFWVVKLNSLGDIEWQKTLGGTFVDYFFDIEQSNDSGYIIGGRVLSDDGDITNNQGGFDSWIVKLNSVGVIQWQKTFGGTSNDYLFDIQKTVDGGFVTVGYTESNDGDVSINRGNGDCWVVKFTETGIIQWEKTFGGTGHDEANMIKQTNDGNYIFIGYTNSSDGDITFSNGSYDFWIVKIDGIGNILWQKTLGGTDEDYGYSIQQTSDGGFITIGYTNSTSLDITENNGLNDFWIVKLEEETLSINNVEKDIILIYPNPVTSILNIKTVNEVTLYKIVITDLLGNLVLEQKLNNLKVNIKELSSGVYILQLKSEKESYKIKFIKH
tara:strand:- start:724 stop:2262 length:1539 start_codon:yes stop_codon:yes gene_type:complete